MVGTYYHFKAFWDIRDEDVFFCTSDIGWVVGHSYIVYAPLVAGATTVFREGAPDSPNPGVHLEHRRAARRVGHVHGPYGSADVYALRPGISPEVQFKKPAVSHLCWRAVES